MNLVALIFAVAAAACFIRALFPAQPPVNLIALGFVFLTVAWIAQLVIAATQITIR